MFVANQQKQDSGPPCALIALGCPAYGTYQELLDCYLDRRAAALDGAALSPQVIKNVRSHLGGWLRLNQLTETSIVGDELGERFPTQLAAYRAALRQRGLTAKTISDRVRTINGLRESLLDLRGPDGLPRTLARALQHLIVTAGVSRCRVMRAVGLNQMTMGSLLTGVCVGVNARAAIPKLEEYFRLPAGTLSSRLPRLLKPGQVSCETDYRVYLAEIGKLRYRLKVLPPQVADEWVELAHFHTDPAWATLQGFEFDPRYTWSIRPGRERSATEQLHEEQIKSFFGFLALPPEGDEPRLRGKGMPVETFTLALLTDAAIVAEYAEFRRTRSFNQSANNGTRTFLNLCTKLLYKDRGYLWQHPEFGFRLPNPVPPEQWAAWCEMNRAKILKLKNSGCARKSKHGSRPVSRDPFVPIRPYIHGRQHPLTVLWELASSVEAQLNHATYLPPVRVAETWRNLLLVKLLAANPLRGGNLTALTYFPRCWDELREPGVIWVTAAEESNFYQMSDGGWRLRIPGEYFKVYRGNYDVPVPRSLWATLRTYLFLHRPVLNRAILAAIKLRRRKEGLAPFNSQEETAVLRCPYVFRYVRAGVVGNVSAARVAHYKGTEQMEVRALRNTMMRLTRAFLPSGIGFGPHACRHLVATEKLKNDPSGK